MANRAKVRYLTAQKPLVIQINFGIKFPSHEHGSLSTPLLGLEVLGQLPRGGNMGPAAMGSTAVGVAKGVECIESHRSQGPWQCYPQLQKLALVTWNVASFAGKAQGHDLPTGHNRACLDTQMGSSTSPLARTLFFSGIAHSPGVGKCIAHPRACLLGFMHMTVVRPQHQTAVYSTLQYFEDFSTFPPREEVK